MKKNVYQAPEMEVVKLAVQSSMLVISGGGPGKDPSTPDYAPELELDVISE